MEKILVAEDDESVRAELTRLLCANGYRVVSEPPCDMALLDVNLPGESGYEICRRLRTQWDIPVIFLTGRDSAEDELLGFGVGADDYIRKPYNSAVLLAVAPQGQKRPDGAGSDLESGGTDCVQGRAEQGAHQKRNPYPGVPDGKRAVRQRGADRGSVAEQSLC